MSIETIADAVRTYARGRKERLLSETTHFLLAIRDGRPAAVLSADDLNALIALADAVAAGYGADALAVVVEGVFPTVDVNPVSGQPWQRGEAEQLWLEHDGVEKGWVAETQIIAMASRTGETVEEGWPFRLAEDTVAWGDIPLPFNGTGLAQALASRIDRPAVDAARVPDPGDGFTGDAEKGPFYDAEYGRVALDIGCTRVLGNQLGGSGEALLIVDSEDRADYFIDEGLPRWQVEVATRGGRE